MANATNGSFQEKEPSSTASLMQYWTQQFRNVSLAALVPCLPLIPLGICGNLLIIIAFVQLKNGVGKTLRFYYIALASCQIFIILSSQLMNFLEYQLKVLTSDKFHVSISNMEVVCKLTKFFWQWSAHSQNWIYFAVNAERAISISSPLRSRALFTSSRACCAIACAVLTGLPLAILTLFVISHITVFTGLPICGTNGKLPPAMVLTWRLYSMFSVQLLPNLLSLALNLLVIITLRRIAQSRDQVFGQLSLRLQRRKAERHVTLTVTILSVINCCFYVPFGFLTLAETVARWYTNEIEQAFALHVVSSAFLSFAVVTVTTNVVFYYFRLRAFRLFVTCRNC